MTMSEQNKHTESDLVEFVRAIDVRAPEELHGRIGALVAERTRGRTRSQRHRRSLQAGLGGAVAVAAVLVLALLLGSSGSGTPALSAEQASLLAQRPATLAAPAQNLDVHSQAELAANVDGVAFPYWEDHFGWRSSGARTDHLGGRNVMTVFYSNARGQRIGYAIVSGTPAPRVTGGVVRWRDSTPYRVLSEGDSQLVVWHRDGHLCILAGHGVHGATLLKLASWDDHDSTT
jgi:hypothetical protein